MLCHLASILPSQHTYIRDRATDGQVAIHLPAPVDSTNQDVTRYNTTFTEHTVTTTVTSTWPAAHPQALQVQDMTFEEKWPPLRLPLLE